MVTDDERREVAEGLRGLVTDDSVYATINAGHVLYAIGLCFKDVDRIYFSGYDVARLADLIDPCDMSQDCRDNVARDPTGRGVDSIYEWCRERLEGADGAEDELCCAIMRAIEDYRHPERATAHTVRPVDREALLALADEMDDCGLEGWACGLVHVGDFARRIREACGEVVA